jgi:hypothetical protein
MRSRTDFIEIAEATSAPLREFAAYWRSKTSSARLPRPAAIDPMEIPHLLPCVVIAQIEPAPFRVRYRLVGTRLVEAHGGDYTGRYLDECGFLIEKELTACYRRVVAERRPLFLYYAWEREGALRATGRIGASETGFFPLSSDGETIDRVISFADPNVAPRSGGSQRPSVR